MLRPRDITATIGRWPVAGAQHYHWRLSAYNDKGKLVAEFRGSCMVEALGRQEVNEKSVRLFGEEPTWLT